MTIPLDAEMIIARIAGRHGFMVDELLGDDQDDDTQAARREAYAALMINYSAGVVGVWFNRARSVVDKGAASYRRSIGARAIDRHRPMVKLCRPATVPKPAPPPMPSSRQAMDGIATEVAGLYGLTLQDLKGPIAARSHSVPRQHCMWALSRVGYSRSEIGRRLGGRDPTTVLHGIRAHAARLAAELSGRAAA